jgi:archaemetzincin
MPARVRVAVFGTVPREVLQEAAEGLRVTYGLEIKAGPALEKPQFAFNKIRNQYYATAILRRLTQSRPPESEDPVLALTDVDLFVADADYVFGDSDRAEMTAIVSLKRLEDEPGGRPVDPAKLKRRVQTEVTRVIGHLLGLSPCDDSKCSMFPANSVREVDKKGPGLCGSCKAALGLSAG